MAEEKTIDNKGANNDKNQNNLIEKANEAAARLEEANKKMASLISHQENIAVERTLAGKADVEKVVRKKETDAEYAKRVMANDYFS